MCRSTFIRSKLLAEGYAANAAQIKQHYLNLTCNTMILIAGLPTM